MKRGASSLSILRKIFYGECYRGLFRSDWPTAEVRLGSILLSGASAIALAADCEGAIEGGSSLQFSAAFPGIFRAYGEACQRGEIKPGRATVYDTQLAVPPRRIILLSTRLQRRAQCENRHLDSALAELVAEAQRLTLESVAVPALCCEHGGPEWLHVRAKIEKAFAAIARVKLFLFVPG